MADSVAVMLGGGEAPQIEGEMPAVDEAFQDAANAVLDAINSGDRVSFAEALKAAIDIHSIGAIPAMEEGLEL